MKSAGAELTGARPAGILFGESVAKAGGVLAALIGAAAILGWLLGIPVLASFGPPVPMAPSSALFFILYGLLIFVRARRPKHRALHLAGMIAGGAGSLAALLLLYLSLRGIRLELEHLGIPISGTAAGVPLGYMSSLTAACFILVGLTFVAVQSDLSASSRRAIAAFCLSCLTVLASFVSVIGYLLGSPLLYGRALIPAALSTTMGFFILGAALFAFSGMQLSARIAALDAGDTQRAAGLVLVYLALVIGIVSAGAFYFQGQARTFRAQVENQLSAIVELKTLQLIHWRDDQLGDGALFFNNPNFSSLLGRYFAAPGDEDARLRLRIWLQRLRQTDQYNRIRLYDAAGFVRLEEPAASPTKDRFPASWLSEINRTRNELLRDFYRDSVDQRIYLALQLPIYDSTEKGKLLGILETRIDPEEYLYPLINTWPTSSRTAETLLVRREGDAALFLNELRHGKDTALNLRSSLRDVRMPAVQAVLGKQGTVDGLDERGVPVIASLRSVPDSPWFLVARIEASEAFEPLQVKRREIIGLLAAFLIGAGAVVGAVWRNQRAQLYRERYRTAETLRASQEKFSAAFRTNSAFMAMTTIDGVFAEVNDFGALFLGYARDELIGRTIFDTGILPSVETLREIRGAIEKTSGASRMETQLRAKDGTRRDGLLSIEAIMVDGAPSLLLIMTDITELKRAENRIRKLNRVYAMLSDISEAIVRVRGPQALFERACRISVDKGGFLFAWVGVVDETNQRIRIVASAAEDEKSLSRFTSHWEDLPREYHQVDGPLADGTPVVCNDTDDKESPEECQKVGGALGFRAFATFPLIISGQTKGAASFYSREPGFFDEEELRLLGELAMDISFAMEINGLEEARKRAESQREAMEAQFLQAQKMEAVGRLAGGVAHDFNNMLQVINSYTDLVLTRLDPVDPLHAYVQQISRAGKRSADLTQQLLAFARKQVVTPKLLDLNETISSMLRMLPRLIGEDIHLLWKPAAGALPIRMDPSQIDQILANLTVNSRDAIAGNGKITIETAQEQFDQDYCDNHVGFRPGQYAMLAVSDDGCGMSREVLERVFEPFFTTKPQGQGTGLGLATVYGIVKQNDGFINLYSEPGKGTTIRIYLPRYEPGILSSGETSAPVEMLTGKETVLLVEDEPAILEITHMLLTQLGYSVLPANRPQEAMQIAKDHTGEIHLLLTDVVMPDMSGRDLYAQLQVPRPALKCIYMSGYTADAIAHRGLLDEGIHFLPKPFSLEGLARKIREALSS